MFKTLLTTLAMAGAFVEVVSAAETVTSSSGIMYNCPSIEPIEVAYAESCPKNSRNSLFQYTGSTSSASYSGAPNSYMVASGNYNLLCLYGKNAQGQDVEPLQCRYRSGSGEALTPVGSNTAECPDIGQSDPAPSPAPGTDGDTLAPPYNCPWNSNDPDYFNFRSIIYSGSFSGGTGAPIYQCAIRRAPGLGNTACAYNVDGVLNTGDSQDCPSNLCAVQKNMRRSLKRGVYVQDNPIHSRQVKAASLREAGKKRMPKPSTR